MFLKKLLLSLACVIATTACAGTQPPALVERASPKAIVATTQEAPRLDIRVRGPLLTSQVEEIKAGYMKAFPGSRIYIEREKLGSTVFVIVPK